MGPESTESLLLLPHSTPRTSTRPFRPSRAVRPTSAFPPPCSSLWLLAAATSVHPACSPSSPNSSAALTPGPTATGRWERRDSWWRWNSKDSWFFFFFPHVHCQPGGPVFDFSLHECSSRRKIPVRSLVQPVSVELQRLPQNVWFPPLQQLSQGVGGLQSNRATATALSPLFSFFFPSELRRRACPAAMPGQLPQLQHHARAPAAGHPSEGDIRAAAWQPVSHHAALQVGLPWPRSMRWRGLRWGLEVNSAATGCSRGRLPACTTCGGLIAGKATRCDSLCLHPT